MLNLVCITICVALVIDFLANFFRDYTKRKVITQTITSFVIWVSFAILAFGLGTMPIIQGILAILWFIIWSINYSKLWKVI